MVRCLHTYSHPAELTGSAPQTSLALSTSNDLLTSLTFSPRSTHLATSSLDHHIRILHPAPSTSTSTRQTRGWTHAPREWKAHDGPVLSLAWAPPEFGNVLVSGGVDGAVKIWREDTPPLPPPAASSSAPRFTSSPSPSSSSSTRHQGSRGTTGQGWSLLTTLTDSLGTIRSLDFAPPDFGLKLACVASDSMLRIWECLDPFSLRDWALVRTVDLGQLPLGVCSANSLGLGPGGSSGVPNSVVGVGESGVSSATTSSSVEDGQGGLGGRGGTVESDGGWAANWCKEGWWGERLAVTAGSNGVIRLLHFPSSTSPSHTTHGSFHQFLTLLPPSPTPSHSHPSSESSADPLPQPHTPIATYTPPTSSLSWAPPSGRSFQLLASGSRDSKARVWRLMPPSLASPSSSSSAPSSSAEGGGQMEDGEWRGRLEADLEVGGEGGAGARGGALQACRVEWNITGTVLSTSGCVGGGGGVDQGGEGRVKLWKPTYTGQWRLLASLSTTTTTEDTPPQTRTPNPEQLLSDVRGKAGGGEWIVGHGAE
ncbi:hypothetical protein JCM11641_002703 [Rhodosporidiobolus odoratus]